MDATLKICIEIEQIVITTSRMRMASFMIQLQLSLFYWLSNRTSIWCMSSYSTKSDPTIVEFIFILDGFYFYQASGEKQHSAWSSLQSEPTD